MATPDRINRPASSRRAAIPLLAAVVMLAAAPSAALADDASANEASKAMDKDEIQRFCSNIADAAQDRRYKLQSARLTNLKTEIDERIAALEKKRKVYEGWLKRRNDFLDKARDGVVAIYANMTPDAAAEKLAALDVELAAAIVMKLDPKRAGVVLNEMDSKVAAALTGIMASAARKEDPS